MLNRFEEMTNAEIREEVQNHNYTDAEWNKYNLHRFVDYRGIPLNKA